MSARIVPPALLAAAMLLPLAACTEDTPPDWVPEAREKSAQLGSQLISAPNDSLAEQGPVGGIEVRNVKAPELAETIERLYPEDRATNFAPGELRGAFTVTVDLSAAE